MEQISDREYDNWIKEAFGKPKPDTKFIIVPEGLNSFDVFMKMLNGEVILVEENEES